MDNLQKEKNIIWLNGNEDFVQKAKELVDIVMAKFEIEKNPKAKHFSKISYDEVIEKELRVMDLTAISMAKENNLPIVVFKQTDKKSLSNVLEGKGKFTIIK